MATRFSFTAIDRETTLPVRLPPPPLPTKPPTIRLSEPTPIGRQIPPPSRTNGLTIRQEPEMPIHGRIGAAIGGLITGGPLGAIGGFIGGGRREPTTPDPRFTGSQPGLGLGFGPSTTTCGFGQRRDPNTGLCKTFFGSQPGFDRGREGPGEAVAGGFNMPAFVPDVVGTITRIDGSAGPILRCPRGTVLATDDLCYAKGTKGLAAHRKWPMGTRPFLSGGDVKCLRRANTLRRSKGSRKLLRELGMG